MKHGPILVVSDTWCLECMFLFIIFQKTCRLLLHFVEILIPSHRILFISKKKYDHRWTSAQLHSEGNFLSEVLSSNRKQVCELAEANASCDGILCNLQLARVQSLSFGFYLFDLQWHIYMVHILYTIKLDAKQSDSSLNSTWTKYFVSVVNFVEEWTHRCWSETLLCCCCCWVKAAGFSWMFLERETERRVSLSLTHFTDTSGKVTLQLLLQSWSSSQRPVAKRERGGSNHNLSWSKQINTTMWKYSWKVLHLKHLLSLSSFSQMYLKYDKYMLIWIPHTNSINTIGDSSWMITYSKLNNKGCVIKVKLYD